MPAARHDGLPRAEDLGLLGRFGVACARKGAFVVGLWVVVGAAIAIAAVLFGGQLVNDFTIPGSDSQDAQDLLEETFPQVAGNSATLVFAADNGTLADPENQQAVQAALQSAGNVDGVISVSNPYTQAGALNQAQTLAFSNVQFIEQSFDVSNEQIDDLKDGAESAVAGVPVEVNFTGAVITNNIEADDSQSELIGIIVALIILIILMGTLVSAVVPVLMALVAVGVGLALVQLEADIVNLNLITPTLATMLGLGVGIDYSLFIVTRFRQGLRDGYEPHQAAGVATATAGRAILFAAITVIISVAALVVFGMSFITVLGLGAAVTVVTAVAAALTLLPAVLGLLGHRISALKIPFWGERRMHLDPSTSTVAGWARFVTGKAAFVAPAAVIVLVVLALPAALVDLGASDAGTAPKGQTQRVAYDQVATAFGPGVNGPLLIAVNQSQVPGITNELAQAASQTDGVAAVNAPVVNSEGTTAVITVVPATSPQSDQTSELVTNLRENVIPGVIGDQDASAFVGGVTASFDDIATRITDRLIFFVLVVMVIIMLILTTAFRSLSVGIQAGLCMLLSAAASFGVLVAVFQEGWLIEIVGLDTTGPIESYLPPVVFAILFGLSTDYQVFISSRIREDYARGEEPREAIRTGMYAVGPVVVAAALIMTAVFLSFILADTRVIKEFGLALGVSILIDAFIVRMTLVPAIFQLMGRHMWWIPGWLDRILPHVTIEPSADDQADGAEKAPAAN